MSDADWIEKAVVTYMDAPAGEMGVRPDHPLIVHLRQAYAAHSKAVDHDKLAERIAEQICYDCSSWVLGIDGGQIPTFDTDQAKRLIEAGYAPVLARNATMEDVLRECRAYVQEAVNEDEREYNLRPLDEGCRQNLEESSALLHGIDQLTAKGAGQ